jgi:CBS domain-containing protein
VFVVLGLGAGLLAVVISRGLFIVEGWYRRLPVGEFWHPIIGAVIFASIGLAVPRALGVGYDAIEDLLANRLAVGTIALLAAAKLVAWWAALGSGTSGGTLAPILLISAGYGGLFGAAVDATFPALDVSPGAFAIVAMAATFGAATRATFASMVFVFELTRDYDVILPLMLATVIAELVAMALTRDSIMTEKLTRRGLRVHSDYAIDPFRTVPIAEIMTRRVETLPGTATVGDARLRLRTGRHSAYPIVDGDGRCMGIVARGDLLGDSTDDDGPILEHATTDVITVAPDDLAVTALHRMIDQAVDHLPVIDGGRLVGDCTRTDLMAVRARQLDLERHQPGWQPPRPRRARRRPAPTHDPAAHDPAAHGRGTVDPAAHGRGAVEPAGHDPGAIA